MKKFIKKIGAFFSNTTKKIGKPISKVTNKIKNSKKLKKICSKSKEFVLHITDKNYLQENIRVVILGILLLIFLVATIVFLIVSSNISKIEEEKINKETREYANYIEDIVDIKSKDLDKYIIYTLDYYYNVNNVDSLSSAEISEFMNNKLHKKVKEEDITNFGVNPEMQQRNITFDNSTNKYVLNDPKYDRKTISEKETIYYKQKRLRKKKKKKYVITYEKYKIDDPYKVLDFYLEKNRQDEGTVQEDGTYIYNIVDITEMKDYLTTGKISHLKHFLNQSDEYIKKFAKKSGKIRITYVINDNNEVEIYKVK